LKRVKKLKKFLKQKLLEHPKKKTSKILKNKTNKL